MRFSPDDAVFRVRLNLQQVSCAAEALRAWLPLVSQLRPVAMEFEAAHPDGLCRGFLADLLVVPPPHERSSRRRGDRAGPAAPAVTPIAERLGLDPAGFEADEEGTGGVLSARGEPVVSGDAPHGAYLLLVRTGADPLHPEGEATDHEGTGEDLL
ncbi:hypothetical protein ACK8N7_35810 [Streptomyces griseobrunneus]